MKTKTWIIGTALSYAIFSTGAAQAGLFTISPTDNPFDGPACSAEAQQKSIDRVDVALKTISASPNFKSAQKFNATVIEITAMKEPSVKIARYSAIVGVDANDSTQLAQFIGARDHAPYVEKAEKNLDLTPAQADAVVSAITIQLLSGMN